MSPYKLHYAGSTFTLKDAMAARDLMQQIEQIRKNSATAERVKVSTDGGVLFLYVHPEVELAISGFTDSEATGM